jgi:hypothetical protein
MFGDPKQIVLLRSFRNAALIFIACLSLVTSSLGACICPHHETENLKPALSCHSETHETLITESDTEATHAESPCICFRDFSPVILNKSENKRPVIQKESSAAVELYSFGPVVFAIVRSPAMFAGDRTLYKTAYSRSAPSRAPPRL